MMVFLRLAAALLVVSSTNAQQISEGYDNYGPCINNTFFEVSGTSPAIDAPVCLRDDSPFIQTSMGCMYYFARHSFSMFYSEFPSDVFYPRAPNVTNLINQGIFTANGADETVTFEFATREQMDDATDAVLSFMKCGEPFSVVCGGHSNAGASIVSGRRLLSIRMLNRVEAEFNDGVGLATSVEEWDGSKDLGSSLVGAGSTAGRSLSFTHTQMPGTAVPVGQKPSVGTSGLTLGGGFGFLTRFSGFLCDRLKALTAIVPSTSEGKAVRVTKDNEYSDLFWASCGGGGGNFAVITEFEFNPVQVCLPNDDDHCYVLRLHLFLPVSAELVNFYQEWSLQLSTRITANMEVHNKTHVVISGIFLGDESLWEEAVNNSGASPDTPISSDILMNAAEPVPFVDAVTNLTGWTDDAPDSSVLLKPFYETRDYFKFASLFLHEPLPAEAINILINEAMHFENDSDIVVFEFQALGGDPGKPNNDDEEYPGWSPKNLFASVPPKDSAFPHRGARHCLMLVAKSATGYEQGDSLLLRLESVYAKVRNYVVGGSVYYNHNDPLLPLETPYFYDGVELNPGVEYSDKDFWINKLADVRSKYNPDGMLVNNYGVGMAFGNDLPMNEVDEKYTESGDTESTHTESSDFEEDKQNSELSDNESFDVANKAEKKNIVMFIITAALTMWSFVM